MKMMLLLLIERMETSRVEGGKSFKLVKLHFVINYEGHTLMCEMDNCQ